MGLQRFAAAGQFGGIDLITVRRAVIAAGGCIASPLTVIGRNLGRAVTLPVAGARFGGRAVCVAAFAGAFRTAGGAHAAQTAHELAALGVAFAVEHRRISARQTEFFAGCLVGQDFEKRVVVEHLLDFLGQFEGGQLQQSDRLLQLGRERQVLGGA